MVTIVLIILREMISESHAAALLVVFVLPTVYGGTCDSWAYTGDHGPSSWYADFPHCAGKKQSPINIVTAGVKLDNALTPFDLSDFNKTCSGQMKLKNVNGHTAQASIEMSGSEEYSVMGGGLPNKYQLKQLHFHWGKVDQRGSEHKLNGNAFPMEMHMVTFSAKYPDFDNAVDKPKGLAVLGFFFKVGPHNTHFDKLLSHFDAITNSNAETEILAFSVSSLLPSSVASFYRYEGSLTTPPCYESVIWTLFTERIEISEQQIEKFRQLKSHDAGENGGNHAIKTSENHAKQILTNFVHHNRKGAREPAKNEFIVDNFRPVQELNGRKVWTNDPDAIFK